MKPTSGKVFVRKADTLNNNQKFETIDNSEARFVVTHVASDVVRCKTGDFILFKDYRKYTFDGEDIYIVEEDDIVATKESK